MTVRMDLQGFRKKLSSSKNLAGPLLTIQDPSVVETLLYADPDLIIVDMEHSAITVEHLSPICMAAGDLPVIARIKGLEKNEIKRVLDSGVHGIIVPGIESVDDAINSVIYSRFAPTGKRGAGPGRASGYGNDILGYVGGEPLVFVQIETRSAFERVEEIASVKGLDGLFVGPFDLSIALGIEFSWENSKFTEAVRRIRETAENRGLMTGIYSPMSKEPISHTSKEGFNFLMLGMDRETIVTGYKETINHLRSGLF